MHPSSNFVADLQLAIQTWGQIDKRGDVVRAKQHWAYCNEKFGAASDLAWFAFFLGCTVREPRYVDLFEGGLRQLQLPCGAKDVQNCLVGLFDLKFAKNEYRFVPFFARMYVEPRAVFEWDTALLFKRMPELRRVFDGQPKPANAFDMLEADIARWGICFKAYNGNKFITMAAICSGTPEPGVKFVVTGGADSEEQKKQLVEMGLADVSAINSLLPVEMHLTPRVLGFYICMSKLLPRYIKYIYACLS